MCILVADEQQREHRMTIDSIINSKIEHEYLIALVEHHECAVTAAIVYVAEQRKYAKIKLNLLAITQLTKQIKKYA